MLAILIFSNTSHHYITCSYSALYLNLKICNMGRLITSYLNTIYLFICIGTQYKNVQKSTYFVYII